jgi:hypothetical protein
VSGAVATLAGRLVTAFSGTKYCRGASNLSGMITANAPQAEAVRSACYPLRFVLSAPSSVFALRRRFFRYVQHESGLVDGCREKEPAGSDRPDQKSRLTLN